PADRRRHVVRLTKAGERALERAEAAQEGMEDEVLAALAPDERALLRELLARALAGVTASEERGAPEGAAAAAAASSRRSRLRGRGGLAGVALQGAVEVLVRVAEDGVAVRVGRGTALQEQRAELGRGRAAERPDGAGDVRAAVLPHALTAVHACREQRV